MNIGLMGLPKSGKTTTFHLLTGTKPDPAHAFRREAIRAVAAIPDERVEKIAAITGSAKAVHTTVEYCDTPPVEAGSAKAEWFTGQIAAHLKLSDALIQVVRAFGSEEMDEGIDILRDIRRVEDELIFADLLVLDGRQKRLEKMARVKPLSAEDKHELALLEQGRAILEDGKPLRLLALSGEDEKRLRGFQFLSEKPLLVLVNADEKGFSQIQSAVPNLEAQLSERNTKLLAFCAELEQEIAELAGEEQTAFLADMGLSEPAVRRILRASFDLLGLLSFFTTNEKETHAWTLRRGQTALEAAATVHTDFAQRFIRAEVVSFDDFVANGGYTGCRHKGLLRLEGKEYPVKDGDILLIRHN
ncbi:MAG: redox-regulated ATPase YchF [Calditrichaeota bacterium]|nr:redox-regulated ATPase YchF [Calditrichota bacterium]